MREFSRDGVDMRILLQEVFAPPEKPHIYTVRPEGKGPEGCEIAEAEDFPLTITPLDRERFTLEGRSRILLRIPCGRCLSPVDTEVPIEIRLTANRRSKQDEDGDDVSFLDEEGVLDVEALLQEEIRMNMPMKVLCREDCRGVCPVCGANLNEAPCDCAKSGSTMRFADAFAKALRERKPE